MKFRWFGVRAGAGKGPDRRRLAHENPEGSGLLGGGASARPVAAVP
jgi:uncharacterized spore protein YtfJ